MPKIEDDMPLQQRRKMLSSGVERALRLVEAASAQLVSARASLSIEPPPDDDEDSYADLLYTAAANSAFTASIGLSKAQGFIDDLLLDHDDREQSGE